MTYSLLLDSLDPKPTRRELEEISLKVPSVARADCAFIVDDWYGIIVSGLPLEEARVFQNELRRLNCETDLVADVEIPCLHHDFRCQHIDLDDGEIILATSMGRRYPRKKSELVFISAGLVDKEKAGTRTEVQTDLRWTEAGPYRANVERNVINIEEKRFFRIDFFFTIEPNRVSVEIDKDGVMFYGGRQVRMKNSLDMTVLMVDLQSLLPPERMNRSLRELSSSHVYPRLRAYEEELRWAFYRLGAKG